MEWVEQSLNAANNVQKNAENLATGFLNLRKQLIIFAAKKSFAQALPDYPLRGTVLSGRLKRIQHIVYSAGWPEYLSNLLNLDWNGKLNYVLKGRGPRVPVSIVCDLYVQSHNNKRFAFIIRTITSDRRTSDQKAIAKLLYLYCMNIPEVDQAYFVTYDAKESPRIFLHGNFYPGLFRETDPVILTDRELWDTFLS